MLMQFPSRLTLACSSSALASMARASATASKMIACWALFLLVFLATSLSTKMTHCMSFVVADHFDHLITCTNDGQPAAVFYTNPYA